MLGALLCVESAVGFAVALYAWIDLAIFVTLCVSWTSFAYGAVRITYRPNLLIIGILTPDVSMMALSSGLGSNRTETPDFVSCGTDSNLNGREATNQLDLVCKRELDMSPGVSF